MVVEFEEIRGVRYAYRVEKHPSSSLDPIVFLHGFTGSQASFATWLADVAAKRTVFCIDLLGHGQTDKPKQSQRYQCAEQVRDLRIFLQKKQVEKAVIYGYSMGGRLALAFQMFAPEMVSALALESASPGLATAEERNVRRAHDQELAAWLEQVGVASFVDYWQSLPLFDSHKKMTSAQQQQLRSERLSQEVVGLANSLRGFSTGEQPNYWPELVNVTCPVLLLTGMEDRKFCRLAQKMQAELPRAQWSMIPQVGHAPHTEDAVSTLVQLNQFLAQQR